MIIFLETLISRFLGIAYVVLAISSLELLIFIWGGPYSNRPFLFALGTISALSLLVVIFDVFFTFLPGLFPPQWEILFRIYLLLLLALFSSLGMFLTIYGGPYRPIFILFILGGICASSFTLALSESMFTSRRRRMRAPLEIPPRYQDTLLEIEQARRQMQEIMRMPEGPFERPGIRLAHRLRQATTISGDFYDVIPRGDGSVGVYLVDVEGHGLPASQNAQAVHQVLSSSLAEWGAGPARQQLEIADRGISEVLGAQNIAVTMNFTEIDPVKMEVRHANAGIPFPLLFRYGKTIPETLQASGFHVGAGYSVYPSSSVKVEVQVGDGDILVIFSDGIIEAKDKRGRLFGHQGIIAAVARAGWESPERIADEILRAVSDHAGKDKPEDDQSLVIGQIGNPLKGVRLAGGETLKIIAITDRALEFSLINAEDSGHAVYLQLMEHFQKFAQSQSYLQRWKGIWQAIYEAILNAVIHGSSRGQLIYIRLRVAEGGDLEVELVQPRVWPDWDAKLGKRRLELFKDKIRAPEDVELGGTVIMLKQADEVSVSNQGRRITMRFSYDTSTNVREEV